MNPALDLGQRIGGGATGVVFRARAGNADLAVKVLNPHLAADPVIRSRFRREAEILAGLRHPAVVRVDDLTEIDGRPALVMEYLPGGSLKGQLLDEKATRNLFGQLADALALLHSRGIVHRDIRPSHILRDESGGPRIIDFGMASVRDLSGLTRSTVFSANPAYSDPYLFGRGKTLAAEDLYSLGAVMHSVVVGAPPRSAVFGAVEPAITAVGTEQLRNRCGRDLAELIASLLDSPARRPRSAAEVADWLQDGKRSGVRLTTECIHCSALMPAGAPLCLSCGRPPLQVRRDPAGEFIVLKKISEKQEVLGPFLARLKRLTGEDLSDLKLIIGDARLYSRAEQKAGVRLPVKIAEGLHPESVADLIRVLSGENTKDITITRYPMGRSQRFKRGPIVTIPEGRVDLPPAVTRLKTLAGASDSPLRRDAKYAVSIAMASLAADPDTVHLVERTAEIWGALDRIISSLEASFAELSRTNLQALYADLERLDLAQSFPDDSRRSKSADDERERIVRLFGEYASAEKEAAKLEQRIVEICRTLESMRPENATAMFGEIESTIAGC